MSRSRMNAGRSVPPLNNLTLSGATFAVGSPEDTVIGSIIGATATSVIALMTADSHLKVVGTQLRVGPTASSAAAVLTLSLTETVNGRSHTSGPFAVSALASSASRGNDGTGTKPVGAVDVNTSNWSAGLAGLSPGGSIYLAPGDYGNIDLYGKNFAAPGITIYGQTGVHMQYLAVANSSGITFRYIDVTGANSGGFGCSIGSYCDRILFDHITGTAPSTPLNTAGGYSTSQFFWCRDSTNNSITNSIGMYYNSGLTGQSCDNTTIRNVLIKHYSNNAMFFRGMATILIDQCFVTLLDAPQMDGNHFDGIQFADDGVRHSTDVTITNCNVYCGVGCTGDNNRHDGIYLEYSDRILIQNCAIIDGALFGNGIVVSDCTHSTIVDNYCNGSNSRPDIFVRTDSDIATVSRNQSVVLPYTYYNPTATNPVEHPPTNVTFGAGADANTTVAAMSSANDDSGLIAWQATHLLCPLS